MIGCCSWTLVQLLIQSSHEIGWANWDSRVLAPPMCNWILDFLTDRPHTVQVRKNTANVITLSTGSPQGCVLSPLLLTLMTYDCMPKFPTNHIVKFADNTTIVDLMKDNNDLAYRERVVKWWWWWWGGGYNLILNITKTKEIIIDFRKKCPCHAPSHQQHSGGGGHQHKVFGVVHYRWSHLDCKHCIPGQEGTADGPPAPSHTHHFLQEHHREYSHQLHLCVVQRLCCLWLGICEESGEDRKKDHWDFPSRSSGYCH